MRSIVMDCDSIPPFALFRQTGTVIVRVKMESSPRRGPPAGQLVHRPTACERCSRTRLISQYSDCDSDFVEKCRPYRPSSARSRYVKVCATVCLLLLAGLPAQCSAAPRNMERTRRAADAQENELWANPCDYNTEQTNSKSPLSYSPKLVKNVALQARNLLRTTAEYKDKFALKLHSYDSYERLLQEWTEYEWLRKFPGFVEDVLPKGKTLNKPIPEEKMNELMGHIEDVLPPMYKGLKMVLAGLHGIDREVFNDNIVADASLKENINHTMHNVRGVLCLFSEVMKSFKLEILPLPNEELPSFKAEDKLTVALLIYRDTLNYLDYLAQVFQKMYDSKVTPKA
ncbi:uncharacterized protein LOC106708715 [Papilio machaon]|nr:uncharacterized protein LOC106708715 [Papilio machaon]